MTENNPRFERGVIDQADNKRLVIECQRDSKVVLKLAEQEFVIRNPQDLKAFVQEMQRSDRELYQQLQLDRRSDDALFESVKNSPPTDFADAVLAFLLAGGTHWLKAKWQKFVRVVGRLV